jgi:hypothetical protein
VVEKTTIGRSKFGIGGVNMGEYCWNTERGDESVLCNILPLSTIICYHQQLITYSFI